MTEISADIARQLGKDFTMRHPVTVYAMTKTCLKTKSKKITSTKVKAVTNQKCEIAVVTCRGDLCEMKTVIYKLNPPLASAEEFKSRIPQIHQDVCAPKISWLLTDPLALIIFITCMGLTHGTLNLGLTGIVEELAKAPNLEGGVETIFLSTLNFGYAVVSAWWFSIVAHGFEAYMATRLCRSQLNLSVGSTAIWATLTFLVGYPIFSRIQELGQAQQSKKSN